MEDTKLHCGLVFNTACFSMEYWGDGPWVCQGQNEGHVAVRIYPAGMSYNDLTDISRVKRNVLLKYYCDILGMLY